MAVIEMLDPAPDNDTSTRDGNNTADALSYSATTMSTLVSSSTQTSPLMLPWTAEEVAGIIITCILVPLILSGNALVIISVVKFKRLQIPTNYFVVSLAVADIFIGLSIPFFTAIEIRHHDVASVFVCFSPNRVLTTACGVSILTLVMIAYDRRTALLYPLEYITMMTFRKLLMLVCFVWIYSIVASWAPIALGWYAEEFLYADFNRTGVCSFHLLHKNTHFVSLGAVFMPSCLIILYCYFRIYMLARHHARAIAAVETSVRQNLQIKYMVKDTKYAKTLAIVIGTFLVLWLPFQVSLLLESATTVTIDDWTRNYLAYLAFLNSALNPWIYAYKNSEFRAAFKRICKEWCKVKCKKTDRRSSVMSDTSIAAASSTMLGLSRTNSRFTTADLIHILYTQSMESNDSNSLETRRQDLNRTNSRILVSDILKLYLENNPSEADEAILRRYQPALYNEPRAQKSHRVTMEIEDLQSDPKDLPTMVAVDIESESAGTSGYISRATESVSGCVQESTCQTLPKP